MEKVKRFAPRQKPKWGESMMETTTDGNYVLHSDYARLEGLAREMAISIIGDYVYGSNDRVLGKFLSEGCRKCGARLTNAGLIHYDQCVVGKCEAFLAGGLDKG